MGWFNTAVAAALPYAPKRLVWQVSQRYIAGENLEDALTVIRDLNARGLSATVDLLGEDVTEPAQVNECRNQILATIDALARSELDCGISIKLSELGLRFDRALCDRVVDEIVQAAEASGRFVRIDMEDSSVTDATLAVYRRIRRPHRLVGAVIQACLKRSPGDIDALLAEGIAHVRLCKGIYIEPGSIAHQDPGAIHTAFKDLLDRLLAGGAENVGIATHHPDLVEHALSLLKHHRVSTERYEFQMLLGVAEGLRDDLAGSGHPVRVYVPYGKHWFSYSSRRLRENPEVAGHVIRNLFSRR